MEAYFYFNNKPIKKLRKYDEIDSELEWNAIELVVSGLTNNYKLRHYSSTKPFSKYGWVV